MSATTRRGRGGAASHFRAVTPFMPAYVACVASTWRPFRRRFNRLQGEKTFFVFFDFFVDKIKERAYLVIKENGKGGCPQKAHKEDTMIITTANTRFGTFTANAGSNALQIHGPGIHTDTGHMDCNPLYWDEREENEAERSAALNAEIEGLMRADAEDVVEELGGEQPTDTAIRAALARLGYDAELGKIPAFLDDVRNIFSTQAGRHA